HTGWQPAIRQARQPALRRGDSGEKSDDPVCVKPRRLGFATAAVRWVIQGTLTLSLAAALAQAADPSDLLIDDFEAESYGAWTVRGDAFGPRPARGTLPNQQAVSGFLGRGLVNSYFKGDSSTGTL